MPTKEEIKNFSREIENLVSNSSCSYIDAIIHHSIEIGMEQEVAAKLISSSIKSKIKKEAENLNFIPKSKKGKLPV